MKSIVKQLKEQSLTVEDLRCPPGAGGCGQSWSIHLHNDYVHCLACSWKGTVEQAKRDGEFQSVSKKPEIKGVEEIIAGLREQAKEGRCIECQWCFPHEEVWCKLGFEGTKSTEEHTRKSSHLCLMQKFGFVDEQLHLFTEDLESKQYPQRCEVGAWTEDDGTKIPECLAYSPNLDQVIMVMASKGDYRHPDIQPEIDRHHQYMETLIEASRLHNATKEGRLEKLLNKLNGVAA